MDVNFAIKLKTIRIKNGYSQAQLASKIHVSRTLVAKWEQAKAIPSFDMIQEIAKVLNASIDDFTKDSDMNITKDPYLKWKILNGALITLIIVIFYAFIIFLLISYVRK